MTQTQGAKQAQTILQKIYGMTATAHPLAGERDLNFRIDISGEPRFVLKVMHAGCDRELVEMQCALLGALNNNDAIATPSVQLTSDGDPIATVAFGQEQRLVWMISYLPGRLMSDIAPLASAQLRDLGAAIGRMSLALASFDHPALKRTLSWNLTAAAEHRQDVGMVDDDVRGAVDHTLTEFEYRWSAQLAARPAQAIHNDVNDHNVLLHANRKSDGGAIAGVIDFGDAAQQPVVCELAIACAYAAMDQDDPVEACCELVRGFCSERALEGADIALLLPLIKARLAVSLCVSSRRRNAGDTDPYAAVSHEAAKALLKRLAARQADVTTIRFRAAAGLDDVPGSRRIVEFLNSSTLYPVMPAASAPVMDLGVGSLRLGANPAEAELGPLSRQIDAFRAENQASMVLGRYMEPRLLYQSDGFGANQHPCDERRTVHLGIDVFADAGSEVRAPLAAVVHRVTRIDLPLDYGPLVILRHTTTDGEGFYTLFGHLQAASVTDLKEGQSIAAGEVFCRIGAPPENGGWPPHLHLQLIVDDLGLAEGFPGVCTAGEADAFACLSPNPAALLGCPERALDARVDDEGLIRRREQLIGPSLALSYDQPLHIVRGFGPYLYDAQARAYLDFYNNVAHVGHSHPHVVATVQRQIGLLNTNTRYLHGQMLDYAERLTALLPEPLEVCIFVNSASEANELALRMARAVTGRHDMIVAADAYHGHTTALIEMSPYKYNGPGGTGGSDWVHEVPVADDYRGPYKRGEPEVGLRYAAHVEQLLDSLNKEHACAGFIAETLPSVGGQIVLPEGYLKGVYASVRAHGGLCIADEVQTGFGRLGNAFWGFEEQRVVPDMIVLGKPIANGFPMGAVVTSRAIAEAFDTGMEFFATFGGNPVACAAAGAVLDVVEGESLMDNAHEVGGHFLDELRKLQQRHELIGDVRGRGFFIGVELVHDHTTLEPAADAAAFVVNQLRHRGLLAGIDGPLHNVIKLRPTMVTTAADVARAVGLMDQVLTHATRRFPPTA